MQLGNVSTDPAKDYGIPFARQRYTDSLPNEHPDKNITDFDYFLKRIGDMVDSWANQADADAYQPPTPQPGGGASADWRPQAQTDLNTLRAKYLGILTAMQMDYTARGETEKATAVLTAKTGLLSIEKTPVVVAAYTTIPGSRSAFDSAVQTAWMNIVSGVPVQVIVDFTKYGGNAV